MFIQPFPERCIMGWLDWFSGERSDGGTGRVSDVDVKVKTDADGKITDVLVSGSGDKNTHDHFYNVDEGESGGVARVDWDKK